MSNLPNSHSHSVSDDLEAALIEQELDPALQVHREQLRAEALLVEQERRLRVEKALRDRDTENASRGILIGVIVTSLLGLGVLFWYLLTRPEPTTQPIVVPEQPTPSSGQTPPNINITVPNPTPDTPPEVNTEINVPLVSPSAPESNLSSPAVENGAPTDSAPVSPTSEAEEMPMAEPSSSPTEPN